jgi:hypothetical protein
MSEVDVTESYVVGLVTDDSEVCFTLDAALTRDHPLFYWPPKGGEVGAWARLRWCLRGEVWWNDGPHLDRPARDATGELDWGNIDAWWHEVDVDHLEGEWGTVAIRGAIQTVEILGDST